MLLSRALVALFSDPFLCEALAFRGGTALHKLFFSPQIRYSEDIDLVQVHPAPFGEIFDRMKKVLDFLPNMKRVQKAFNNSLRFKTESTIPPIAPIKIKVETNCKEHFSELGYRKMPFSVENGWYSGSCQINTFALEELIGTKVRALFQRKKGRDLFDLHFAFSHSNVDRKTVMRCFERYMRFSTGMVPTPRQFVENMAVKLAMPEFREDTANYLRPGIVFKPDESWEFVRGWLFEEA